MNWTSLSPVEAAMLWAVASAVAVWLYLHYRMPVHRRVSSLRFWPQTPVSPRPRRKLRDRWALLAQLLFLLLVMLALADIRWGDMSESRSVVMVLDTSVWSQVQPQGAASWIESERQEARRFLDGLPAGDRVLLLRAEADATPILPFTTDRNALRRALAELRPSGTVADIPRALELSRAALSGSRRGLMVYIGPGRLEDRHVALLDEFRKELAAPQAGVRAPQFLVRLVGGTGPVSNRGITGIALRRDGFKPEQWHLLTNVKNYSRTRTSVVLTLSVDGQRLGQQALSLAPGEVVSARNDLAVSQGGLLQAEISPSDALDADNRAVVAIPSFRPVRVAIFTPDASFARELRAVFGTNPYVRAEFLQPGTSPAVPPDVAIYEGANPPAGAARNSIWFVRGTPAVVTGSVRLGWNPQHPVTRWVRTRDVNVRNPAALEVQPGDTVLASVQDSSQVPLIVAREEKGQKRLIIGFNPRRSNLPQQAAFPLLMAGAMEWMTQPIQDVADSLAAGRLTLPGTASRIVAPSGREVPFAREENGLRLLAFEPGIYRVMTRDRETAVAVNTPPLPLQLWKPAAAELAAVEPEPLRDVVRQLWPWFVVIGLIFIWLEWWLFYSNPENRRLGANRKVGPAESLASSERSRQESEPANQVT